MLKILISIMFFLNIGCSNKLNEKKDKNKSTVFSYIEEIFKNKSSFKIRLFSSVQLIALEGFIFYLFNKKKFDSKKKIIFGSILIPFLLFIFRMICPSLNDELRRNKNFEKKFTENKREQNNKNNDKEVNDETLKIFVPGSYVRGLKDKIFHYSQHAIFGRYIPYDFFYDKFNKENSQQGELNSQKGELKKIDNYQFFDANKIDRTAYPGYSKLSDKIKNTIKDYLVFDWNKDLCVFQREKASNLLFQKIKFKIQESKTLKKIIIVAHSYGGEISINALISCFDENILDKISVVYLILICSPLNNATSEKLDKILLNSNSKLKLISFHIQKDYVATNDPTNTNFGFLSFINPFNTNKAINVSDMRFLNKKNKNLYDNNWCGILLKNVNKKVKKEKQNDGMFSEKEFEKTTAHGFAAYYAFENGIIDRAINNFDENKKEFVFIDL